ncbi:hypothetical protein B7R21_02580 [Subtercola boreus]|uniref:Uncharacterized protein n=1 Tax=Subtercola boreus TaxID=120213 RepID=A0A3E0W1N5_9MICO|nr:YdeI/OmpD-associated family protein [Subtercola boreus]RFA16284.1 hypothetical protein B7R21_02580 [Subtercola boreus]
MRFRTTLFESGRSATGIVVPLEVYEALGTAKKHAVAVTINDFTYRSTVTPYRGEIMLPVSAAVRKASGIAPGDEFEVDIVLDDQPREVVVPRDLQAALDAAPEAAAFFETLSYSNRRRFTVPLEEAKTAETRQRRLEKAIENLTIGKL